MVDESEQGRHFPSLFDRSIWKFYEWGVVLAPVIIMLSHWYTLLKVFNVLNFILLFA